MEEQTRAVVIEGLPLVRAGISSVLREQHVAVVAEASTASDAAVLVRGADAHLVVVGDGGGDGPGLADAVQRVKDRNQHVRVVALVPPCSRDELLAILDAGADAIVPHDVGRDQLVEALDAARSGERHLAPALTSVLFSTGVESQGPKGASVLTTREHAVVRLLARGSTNDEIGAELFISGATVKTHLSNAYEKLGARNRYDAVVKATQRGLL